MVTAEYMAEYRARPGNLQRRREIARKARDRNKRVREAVKMTAGCIDCGYDKHPSGLDFDHREDELKLYCPADMTGLGLKRMFEEIMKCDVRCRSCHNIRHFPNLLVVW